MSNVTVYLVGAGPGDAGLISVRGAALLGDADIVVYDYLANDELLALARPTARKTYVGKRGFESHRTQEEINELLVDQARSLGEAGGGIIVRLKGGDPFVFGRGGEEALALRAAGVPYEVVPGITSGVAAAAFAGIPVTHRGKASTVTFATGNEDPAKESSAIDWTALVRMVVAGGTVCFYMGMRNLGAITGRLVECGLSGHTPAAAVQWGTMPQQRCVTSCVADIADKAERAGLGAPAIVLIGAVADLRDGLSWFEAKPLYGRRIVVTRSRVQASDLVAQLRSLGAEVIEFPTIEIQPLDNHVQIDGAIANLKDYDWLVFTSVNGVEAFFGRLDGDARALAGLRVAAIGPATARRLAAFGIKADAVPSTYRGEAVHEAIVSTERQAQSSIDGKRVLIVRASEARETLPELLRSSGADVDVVAAYRTVKPTGAASPDLALMLDSGEIDAVTFTSSSTVRNLVDILGDRAASLKGAALFSIGPITSITLADMGFEVAAEAAEYTIEGLVEAMKRYWGGVVG